MDMVAGSLATSEDAWSLERSMIDCGQTWHLAEHEQARHTYTISISSQSTSKVRLGY